MNQLKVSIIIPCKNEEKYIGKVIDNILAQDYSIANIEVLIVDGNSKDKTASIVDSYSNKFPQIKLLSNPKGFVPFAMNIGIKQAKGDVMIRMDAHAEYPNNYVSALLTNLKKLNADNVGGVWITTPGDTTLKAKAIAIALSNKYGVGNAMFRLGIDKPMETDTVPFGCYPMSVFEKIGLFDEEMLRNQDDEFNGRLVKNGGKIFLIPDIKIIYFARTTFSKLWKLYYQYGLFKPLVNRKLKQPTNVRQFAPPILVSGIVINLLLCLWHPLFVVGLISLLGLYILISTQTAIENKNFKLTPYLICSFMILHISYGIGYLQGFINFILLNKKVKQIKDNR
ncbi:MAG: hypothetical protein RJA07_2559 [Bacteroidota bacterium]|jgi:glycosyltransferase involved in cell wall biosynthesis